MTMASRKEAIIAAFIAKIQVGYNLPMHMDAVSKSERLKGVVEMLRQEEEPVLEHFSKIWVEEYTKTTLPTWADAMRVVKLARLKIAQDRGMADYKARQAARETKIRHDVTYPLLADETMKSDLARRACDEGWHIELHDFVTKHGRPPAEREGINLRAQAASTDRSFLSRTLNEFEKIQFNARLGRAATLRSVIYPLKKQA